MFMPFLELFDETLDINSTENYELSVQAGYDGFSFCLLDTIRNKFVLIRVFEPEENKSFNADRIDEIVKKDDFLTRHYKKVRIVTPSLKATLIPAPLFDPGKKDVYFTFNHIKEDQDIVLANKIIDPDAFLIFALSKPVSDLLNTYYPGVHPFHHLKPLLNHISHKRKSVHDNYIHIHVERELFNLIIFGHNKLRFCNTFNYRNITDILYFVINAFKNLDIKQEDTIYLSGLTEKHDDLSSNLSIYVRNIKFAETSGNFSFSYVFDELSLHRYINLFSVTNCE
jgi:hypothetical protein